jgi:hypothetical protein
MSLLSVKDLRLDKPLSAWVACIFAREVLPLFEKVYPKDKRPLKAIETAEAWLRNPADAEAADAVYAAADAVYAAACAAEAAYAAAYSAEAATCAAAYAAVCAAEAAAYAAEAATCAAAYAAAEAATAACAAEAAVYAAATSKYIHNILYKNLSFIIDYKVKNDQGFGNIEAVFEAASDADKEKLLFLLKG